MEKKELTIADVWAILAESSAMHKEIDQIMKESAQRMEETDRRMEETARQMKETDRQMKETDRQMKETDRQMKETDRRFKELDKKLDKLCVKVGGIDDNQGHHAEQFFQDVFRKKLEFGEVKYDEMVPNLAYKGKKDEIEFDIALVNGESVALIEVKNRIHPDFVKILAEERVEKFREFFHEFDNYDVYLGIAGFSFSDEVLDRASSYGIGIIKQVGEGVEIKANNLKAY